MKHLLDIPGLDPRAFIPVAGRMRLYGKSDSPAPPDYVGQAKEQAAGNLAAARVQTQANRINQVTPYGTLKYTQGDGGFDQAGYDAALSRYNSQQEQIRSNAGLQEYYGKTGQLLTDPDRNNFVTGGKDNWSSTIELSPEGQALLDAYNRTSLGMADLQGSAMDRVRATLGQDFDMSGLQDMTTDNSGLVNEYMDYVRGLKGGVDPNTGMDAWDKATDLMRQRQNPELDRQQAALDAKLANQGLTAGSEGWGIQQQNFGKTRNDADIAAQMAGLQAQNQFFNQATSNQNLKQQVAGLLGTGVGYGFQNAGLNNAARQQQLMERATLRNMPLQELNALRTGSQVTNPNFSSPGQQGQTSGPDLLGATSGQYNAQVGQVNAENARAAQETQAAASAAAAGISAWGSYAGATASFF